MSEVLNFKDWKVKNSNLRKFIERLDKWTIFEKNYNIDGELHGQEKLNVATSSKFHIWTIFPIFMVLPFFLPRLMTGWWGKAFSIKKLIIQPFISHLIQIQRIYTYLHSTIFPSMKITSGERGGQDNVLVHHKENLG